MLPIVSTIVFRSSIWELLSTILYLIWCLLVAKGKSFAPIVGIPAVLLYAFVSFQAKYYGEVIITAAVLIPLMIVSIISWIKNKRMDEKHGSVVVFEKTRWIEMAIVGASQLLLGFGYYFLLKAFDTEFLIVSTFSIMTSVFGTILITRRNQFAPLIFVMNDIILVILWGSLVIGGQLNYISVLIMPLMLLINDIYSTFNWGKLKKTQEEKKS